ncbi:exopolysaccharide repressor protein [Mesorhizobium sp. M1A.F.Ca.ET.072.01.1.1]|uniref:exopolysaccharide production repressor protein n=1 Tax=Mesorhizobium sp. M1A.F.Ca.ET.072.01.1.1 TaxID=2496753 RepID=UPI000FD54783|nr:exopolysaccharide production repressor protein [Mesorhizobium sp. M1A.F.Ca.ET.072.01.1.1]RUW54134.1 exopolysaccharide repressor protein [Mesorhizobium sp. M1A.F.Ca.ET.072.01.1.1]TIV05095.1 MAG: exopolysaccharide repressor protein [Mesorhizobium sp.]
MSFRIFYRAFWVILCSNALAVYFASHSIRTAIVTTLACSLLLQIVYFASVLFLIWRSGGPSKTGQRAEHFGVATQSEYQLPDNDEVVRNKSSDAAPVFPMGGISLLH